MWMDATVNVLAWREGDLHSGFGILDWALNKCSHIDSAPKNSGFKPFWNSVLHVLSEKILHTGFVRQNWIIQEKQLSILPGAQWL